MAGTGTFDAEGKFTLHPVPFAIAFDLFNVICTKRASNPLWKITEHFDGSRNKLAWCRKTIDELSNMVINYKRAKLEKAGGSKPDGQRNDLLDFFMEVSPSFFFWRSHRNFLTCVMKLFRSLTTMVRR